MLADLFCTAELLFAEFKDEKDRHKIRQMLVGAYASYEQELLEKRIERLYEQLKSD